MATIKIVLSAVGAFAAAAVLAFVVILAREAGRSGREIAALKTQVTTLEARLAQGRAESRVGQGRANVFTSFNADVNIPGVTPTSFVDPMASVIGDVSLGAEVYVAPFASIRGDEGQPITIGDETNVQDGVVIHALETVKNGEPVANRTYEVGGKQHAVYVGKRVSMAHQSQVHGPARVDDDVFVGMQALVFKSWIGRGSVIEPGAKVVGVTVPPGRYVPAGAVVTTQAAADKLPEITEGYAFRGLNEAVVHVNTSFANGYRKAAEAGSASEGTGTADEAAGVAAGVSAPAEAGHH